MHLPTCTKPNRYDVLRKTTKTRDEEGEGVHGRLSVVVWVQQKGLGGKNSEPIQVGMTMRLQVLLRGGGGMWEEGKADRFWLAVHTMPTLTSNSRCVR